MPKNSKYSLQIETTGSIYSTTQSNILDVPRMLQHKPFWRQPFGDVLVKKKVLIINAPDIAYLDLDERIVAAERFKALQQDGFSIYFHREQNFFELDTTLLSNPKLLVDSNPEPLTDKKISELAAKKLKLSHDQVFVLNPQEFTELMQGIHEDWSELAALETIDLQASNISVASLAELLKKSGGKIKSLNLSQCVNLKKGTLPEHLALDGLEELALGANDSENTYPISTLGNVYAPRQTNLNSLSIKHVLQSAPNLKVLQLARIYHLGDDPLQELTFPSLEILDLSHSDINNLSLGKILTKAPKLKELSLKNCKNLSDSNLPGNLNLFSLETLDVSGAVDKDQFLSKILAKAPNIKIIKLNLNEVLRTALDLKYLGRITFKNARINDNNKKTMFKILINASNLKKLHLNSITNINDLITEDLQLGSLESLDLSASDVNSLSLSKLLNHTSKLKTLDLKSCKSLGNDLTQDVQLSSLESLDLSQSNIRCLSLGRLLSHASMLKTLNLKDCQNLDDDLTEDLQLTSLESFDLASADISNLSLGRLLSHASKLKTLNLKYCAIIGEDQFPEDLNLFSLETLDLSETPINNQSLEKILAKAENIKELYVKLIDNLPDSWHPTSLEQLELSGAQVNDNLSLRKLPTRMPNLKKLSFSSLSTLGEDFPKIMDLSTLKSLDLSQVNGLPLGQLLAKTPKLQKITLFQYNNLNEKLTDNLNLSALEELDITDSTLNNVFLTRLLSNVPKLKKLIIDDHCPLPNGLNLAALEQFTLVSSSSISCLSLSKLLINSPRLRALKLGQCSITGDDLPDNLSLLFLEELVLSPSSIKNPPFRKILAGAPKLKKLTLYSELSDDLADGLNLASLEQLTSSFSNIEVSFIKFLSHAPNLNEIELIKCTIPGDELADALSLSSLQTLKLTDCTISPTLIKNIQAKAPHINIIVNHTPGSAPPVPGTATRTTKAEKTLDADTQLDPNKQFNIDRIFYAKDAPQHPEPSNYRLELFDDIGVNPDPCPIDNAFTLRHKQADRNMETCSIPRSTTNLKAKLDTLHDATHSYYGIQKINLSDEWQALASLSPEEVMIEYHLSHALDVEIAYSKRDNLYFIRKKPGSSQTDTFISIDFILKAPPASTEELPLDVQEQIKACLNFGAKSLEVEPKATGADYLAALKTQRVGACRHRTLVFKSWMEEREPPLPTRIVENDCHSFIEVYYKGRWIPCNLGGHPAKLIIREQDKATPIPQKLSSTGTISSAKKVAAPPVVRRKYFNQRRSEKTKLIAEPSRYIHHVLSLPGHKKLIHLDNDQTLNGLRYQIQKYCNSSSRPCFYIHSPEDLVCSAPYIHRDDTEGTIKHGPGGPLHDFLTEHQTSKSKPVIMVNYSRFHARDIVRLNALLDKERFADGSPVPEDAEVIGLMNPHQPGAYDGTDFSSRFDAILTHSLADEKLAIPPVAEKQCDLTEHSQSINLYGGSDWEDRLLGHWVLQGKHLHFVEGELFLAFKNNKTHIELKNAPWDNAAFQAFWQETQLRGFFQVQGVRYDLPKEFTLSQAEGYSFTENKECITINEHELIPEEAIALNPGLLSRFLGQYLCDNLRQTIQYEAGLLAKNAGKTLNLYLSAPLDIPSWALFLDTCKQHKVSINLTLAPNVSLPEELGISASLKTAATAAPWSADDCPATAYVQSTDIEVTLSQLPEHAIILDVSEVSSAELLVKLDAAFDDKTLTFRFNEQEGALLNALKENKTVILKGEIKKELRHALSDFLLRRQREQNPQGQLIVISHPAHLFPMIPSLVHTVSLEEKMQAVTHQFPEAMYQTRSLVELHAIARYLALHPDETGDKAWQGLITLPPAPAPEEINLEDAETKAAAFNQQRLDGVEQVLQQSPFVFLAGMTGVGKTTFIHEVWKKKQGAVYLDEAGKLDWANDRSEGIKTLFIDEANISSKQWSEFEGLFHKPPRILIGNKLVELTPEHKVIFAGNPLSYGGERQMPSLFARHGNSIIFNPLPPAYLYQHVLKPIFDKTPWDSKELALPILNVAQYLGTIDQKKMLITPRELSMMALLTVSHCKKNPAANPSAVAQYYAYALAERFVPDEKKQIFKEQFKKQDKLSRQPLKLPADLVITANNQPAFDVLCDLMDLRKLRQAKGIQAEGGLGGLIVEGEPGLGKTELVVKTLLAYGLKKGNLNKLLAAKEEDVQECPDEQVFYVIPVSMSYEEKVKALVKIFHEGAVVLIDEINSAPMMERLLNDLKMGKDPKGNPAKKPGFMIFGTQNPESMAGRTRASDASEHREQKVIITEYPKEEIKHILTHKGLPTDICEDMVDEYLSLRQETLRESAPQLCFRDLVNRAEQEITATAQLLKLDFEQQLQLLETKKKQFEGKKQYKKAHDAADALYQGLKKAGETYFAKPTRKNYNSFKVNCTTQLKLHRLELEKHRGWAKLIVNILAFIASAGVGYGIALGIGKFWKGKHFSFYATDSVQKINTIADHVEQAHAVHDAGFLTRSSLTQRFKGQLQETQPAYESASSEYQESLTI